MGVSVPSGDTQPTDGTPSTTAGTAPAQPGANATGAPAPSATTPAATAPASPHGNNAGGKGTPPSAAKAHGTEHQPKVPPGQTTPHSNRP
jgi:hypothetical protein